MTKPILTIAYTWADFESNFVPENAPPTQRRDMRRTFYAGAQSFFAIMMLTVPLGGEPGEAEIDRMFRLAEELERFGAEVEVGNA